MHDTSAGPSAITVRPTGAGLGADISGVDLSRPIDRETFAAIEKAWLDNLVLRFRGQKITDAQQIAFSRWFGDLDEARLDDYQPFVPEHPEIMVISNVLENGRAIGKLGYGEAEWHTDVDYVEEPPKASLLYSLELPPSGGNTGFANMYTAYEMLPAELKSAIEGKRCKHDASHNSTGMLRGGFQETNDPRDVPGPWHPIVRRHPQTGRKALYLGRRINAYIEGFSLEESDRLLNALWAHATQPQFTWTQVWRVGDLVMWDNRCAMHRRDAFDPNSRRIMHRTQVKGDKPFG
jgi:taurine dioxygenase